MMSTKGHVGYLSCSPSAQYGDSFEVSGTETNTTSAKLLLSTQRAGQVEHITQTESYHVFTMLHDKHHVP